MDSERALVRERFRALILELQQEYCERLEALDGEARFGADRWERPGGGGGLTRALAEGLVFERAGVNISEVHGTLSERMAEKLRVAGSRAFYATGLSLIFHPRSPHVPTVHLNVRYLEAGNSAWFGGGADLTPYYLEPDDVRHFHQVLASAAAVYAPDAYARFKRWCDEYFWIRHRKEARGVGGLFFDELRDDLPRGLGLVEALGRRFLDAYVPIVERRRDTPWGERERSWQCLRRGRYVEFNLVYDRGTLFGLETDGRIESILVSMPPVAHWAYAHEPEPQSREAELLAVLRAPRDWLAGE